MKTINKTILFVLLALALVSCGTAAPAVAPGMTAQPAQVQSTPAAGAPGTAGQNGTGSPVVDAVPTVRPTTQAVAALSASFPVFDGLYWTGEVSIMPLSDTAVRLVSGLPCEDVVELLSAGEWRVAERAVPPPDQAGMFSTMARLEKGDQVALIDVKGFVFAELTAEGEAAGSAETFPGCSGTVQILHQQTVSASGAEQAEGAATQYPFAGGCMTIDGQTQVRLFYEGPGDFRASVDFSVPVETGEYGLEEADLSLNLLRSEKSYLQTYADAYATGMAGGEGGEDLEGEEYYAMSEDAGVVRVTSTSPLAGEVVLTNMENDLGETQAFSAGWSCP